MSSIKRRIERLEKSLLDQELHQHIQIQLVDGNGSIGETLVYELRTDNCLHEIMPQNVPIQKTGQGD